jgi:non-ribosomal peptide synthetase component E (peptide arylation enzyme)
VAGAPSLEELRRRYVPAGLWRDRTLTDCLRWCATVYPDRPAVVDKDRRFTWAQLLDLSDNLAAHFLDLGIGHGDVVSVQLPNCAEFLIAHLALARIGAVLSTIHMPYRRREVNYILDFSESVAAIIPDNGVGFDYPALYAELALSLSKLRHVLTLGSLRELIGRPASRADFPTVRPDDLFVLWYTSGTEAQPKGVVHSHNTLVSNGYLSARELWINAADVLLSASPMTHAFGLFPLYNAVNSGASQVLVESFSPAGYLDLAARERATFGFVVPAALQPLLGQPLPELSLRTLLVSGSTCPAPLMRETAATLNVQMAMLWGMTETEGGTFTRPEDDLETVATTCGRPCPGSEIAAFDEDRHLLPPGEVGELGFRGASLCLGYFKNPTATEASRDDQGWFFTGDLASVDEPGYLCIAGRKKDVINRASVKFNPLEVEELLMAHPKVQQAAIVAMPDPRLGERACAFVVPGVHGPPTLAELTDFLQAEGIAKYKLPERLELVSELPLTPTRKVQKALLRERVARQLEEDAASL